MPLSRPERNAFVKEVDDSGLDSESAKFKLKSRIDEIHAGTLSEADFYTAIQEALKKGKIETVVSSKWDTALTDGYNGRSTNDPMNIDLDRLEKKITSGGVSSDIRSSVISVARDRLVETHVQHLINNTASTSFDYVESLKNAGVDPAGGPRLWNPFTQELGDKIIARAQTYLDSKVNSLKTQLDSGLLTEAQIRGMIAAGGSIRNPQMIVAIGKMLDDPERVKARKEVADKATINADAANFKTELDRTAVTGAEIDFDDLTTRITALPEYASLSGPVRAVVEAHLQNKSELIQSKREQLVLKGELNEAAVHEKRLERNRAFIQLALRRLQWLGVGAVAGGALALVLTSGGGLAGIFGGSWTGIPGLFGASGAFPWGTMALGAAGGGVAGSAIAGALDGELASRNKNFQKARLDLLTQQGEMSKIVSAAHKDEGEALKAYTKIAALVEALTKGVDKDKAVATYLKTSSVDALDELLKA